MDHEHLSNGRSSLDDARPAGVVAGQLRRYQVLATGMVPDRLSFIFIEESIC
jgi:hypothetical protein